ncbi:MAG: hypothetical protein A2X52_12840 [Candidatus Rokubacteria bacterium GWC2_70_16]|nr:MAG: hypothetical protein A2X52_12840 [Candidatus Rokubacteria bacterium GWC2_70_16]OGL21229.1 MAG: hypothetical protein A3K12_12240 [Candidatus Rokubacteria bacterium RIFCSPLOWO2_12_FULL_71_19]
MAKDKTRAAERPERPSRAGRRRAGRLLGVAAAAVVVAVVGYFGYEAGANRPGVEMPDQGNLHIQTEREPHVPYNSEPPTSGPHLPYLAPWGVHTMPVAKELQVHNLEDGGVMVQYSCPQGCPELVEKLRAVISQYRDKVILAPYPGLKARIALTAWTRIDAFEDFDAARIQRFIKAYRGIDHHRG